MKDIIIVGSGGLAKEVYGVIKSNDKNDTSWNVIGFISKSKKGNEIIDGLKVIGDDDFILKYKSKLSLFLAISDQSIRKLLFSRFKNLKNISFPNIIHRSVFIDKDNFSIGFGNFISINTIISPTVFVGNFNILNMNCTIAHDAKIGNYCNLNPNSNISGNVIIEDKVTVGSNTVIHQGKRVLKKAIIGMGSVLTRDAKADSTYFGNPARKIN